MAISNRIGPKARKNGVATAGEAHLLKSLRFRAHKTEPRKNTGKTLSIIPAWTSDGPMKLPVSSI